MDSKSSKKCLPNECIDRISELPDPILGKILSYLPTRDAVATSILSTRWKPLFPSAVPLTRLDLDGSHMFYSPSHVFVNFVDKLLNVDLLDVTSVEKVALNCEEVYDKDKIVSWVCAALRLNVQHLRVMSYLGDSKALIGSLNGCTTLMALELGKEFELCLPKELVLPNLKRLLLYSLSVGNDRGALHGLLNSCPVLNELRLNGCDLSCLGTLYIEHPSLKKLFMDGSFNDDECRVVINVPNLEAFAFGGHFVATYVLVNTKLLRSVYIDYDYLNEENHGNKLRSNSCSLAKLIKACSSTTRLRLRGDSVSNLTCLALGRMGNHGLEMLARFLESAPNLTMLTFEEELEFTYYKARWKTFKSSFVCMELHVKKIEIWEYKWTSNEIGLIEYFLKNGRVLEELTIYCLPCENASNLEKISILPRHSEACQVLLKDKKERRACSRESWFQTGHE